MRLRVLGMWGGFPRKGEATSGYLLESDEAKVLIDCGSGVLSKLLFYLNIDQLDAIVLSHYHADHWSDLGVVQYARLVDQLMHERDNPLPVYAFDDQKEFYSLTYKEGSVTKGISFQENERFQIKDLVFTPFKTLHPVECYGFRVENSFKTICYTADGGYSHNQIKMAQNADLLLCEANFLDQDAELALGNHMTGLQAGELALQAGVKKLVLTHLPPLGKPEEIYKEAASVFKGEIILASEGLSIEV